jgi:thioredoxin-like negative regulator of GroEL
MPTQFPAQLKSVLEQVKELLSTKDSGEARRVLASVPGGEEYPQYHAAMARIALLEENKPLALAHIEKASTLAPDNLALLLRIGRIRHANQDAAGVQEVADKMLQLGAQSAKELSQLISFYLRINQPNHALTVLKQAIALRPNDAAMRQISGRYLFRHGDLVEAEQALKDALRLAPANHGAAILLGQLYLTKGEAARAVPVLKQADNAECPTKLANRLRLGLAQAYVDQSELQKAKEKLAEVNNTGSVRFNYIWGQIQLLENAYDLALQSFIVAKRKFDSLRTKDGETVPPLPHLPEDPKLAAQQLQSDLAGSLKDLQFNDEDSSDSNSDEHDDF